MSTPDYHPDLDALPWLASTCYNFLGRHVLMRSTSAEFMIRVHQLLRSFPTCNPYDEPDLTFSFVIASPDPKAQLHPSYALYRNQELIGLAQDYWHLFRLMEWQLDIFLSETVEGYLLLHAGAVTRSGAGIILPASSGSGKSSLTLALLLQNCSYLSDELAVIDPATFKLRAFPKPFSLKNPLIFPNLAYSAKTWFGAELSSKPEQNNSQIEKAVWYVHPDDLKPQSIEPGTVPVRYVIFPRYDPAATPQLQPLSQTQAMRKLLENVVNFSKLGQGGLQLLGRLTQEAKCFSLTVNGPETTAQLVLSQETIVG
ncbi:MAG: hypothetical protein HS126_19365 [Anaerolineales bacterium]|nr:hypothetical protein [Anaerolineales bacterium]